MIIARGKYKGDPLLILGLDDDNVARLLTGQIMLLTCETHGDGIPDGWKILIIHGSTEQKMTEELKKFGAISDETSIFKDRRLET